MEEKFHRFNLVTRLTHLTATILLVMLYATGLRLAWFSGSSPLFEPGGLLDRILPTGQVYRTHLLLGLSLLSVGLVYLIDLQLTGRMYRLTALFFDKKRDYRKKLFYLSIFVVCAVTIISGFSLYIGSYRGAAGYAFMKGLHHYGTALLLILIVVHMVDLVFAKEFRINSIFLGYTVRPFLNLRSLVISVVVAGLVGVGLYRLSVLPKTLPIERLDYNINIDGHAFEQDWSEIEPVRLQAANGANFENTVSEITIRGFRNDLHLFLLIEWVDDTRSFNRNVIKTDSGWFVQVSEFPHLFGETVYYEDRLALSFHHGSDGCAATCHIREPAGMGRHFTSGDTVDVWQWRSISTNPVGRAVDGWWGRYDNDTTGGRHTDNLASGGCFENLNREWQEPFFLPLGVSMRYWIDPRSEHVTPFFGDEAVSVGARVPGIIVTPPVGDRADVSAVGAWAGNRWTVEISRRLKTGSDFDFDLTGSCYMGIALFDNAEKKHAFHLPSIRLEIEP